MTTKTSRAGEGHGTSQRGRSRDPGYKSGSNLSVCQRCGSIFTKDKLKLTWDGLWVCDDDWEPRHPQDFLRIKEEHIMTDVPNYAEDTSNTSGVSFLPVEGTIPPGDNDNEI